MASGIHTRPDGARLYYCIDDFTDGWKSPESVLFVHGLAESTEAWRAWVPYFSRNFRVIRFDLRGFGASTPMPSDHSWSATELYEDMRGLLHGLGVEISHIVGWKSGGTISMGFAAAHPECVKRLVTAGGNPLGPKETASWLRHIEAHGLSNWLDTTMERRMAASMLPEAMQWWSALMGKTAISTLQGYLRWVPTINLMNEIKSIKSPTLIIDAEKNALRDLSDVKAWQSTIPNSELKILSVNGAHVGGAFPDLCAPVAAEFLSRPF